MERTTVFQVISTNGDVLYSNTYLVKCKRWVRKHFTFDELSGRGGYVEIENKVTPWNKSSDFHRECFPKFESRSDGLFRRYIIQTVVTPGSPEALVESKCVAYIINSYHEDHLK